MSPSMEDIIAEAINGKKDAAFAGARRRGWAHGYSEGLAGGASGSIGAYAPVVGGSFDLKHQMDGIRAKQSANVEKIFHLEKELADIDHERGVLADVLDWIDSPDRSLARVNDSVFHKVIEEGLAGKVQLIEDSKSSAHFLDDEFWGIVATSCHVFVIQHDWASAFKSAEIAGGEIKYPYDFSCFEMQINGTRICYLGFQGETTSGAFLFIKTSHGWAAATGKNLNDVPLPIFIAEQVRAVCVSLDAEVAEATVTRAPYKLNAIRAAKGRLPLFDYRIVSLAKRSRPPALNDGAEDGRHKRLHWRRGHWRHFPSHKTWIKWMLVGDPDLGFVDKHYRI